MTSVPERVVAACGGDREYAQHVWDELEAVRLLREEGRVPAGPTTPAGSPSAALLPEQPCPTCLVAFDDNCCPICGRLQLRETTA